MRKLRFLIAVAALAALAVPAAPAAAQDDDRRLLINDCKRGKFKPKRVIVTCADANFRLRGLRWSKWGDDEALGRGTAVVNDCDPNCAQGEFHTYPIRVRAYRARLTGGCVPGWLFTRLAWRFPAAKPGGMPRRGRTRLVCPPSGP
jgi:hypothetical protein